MWRWYLDKFREIHFLNNTYFDSFYWIDEGLAYNGQQTLSKPVMIDGPIELTWMTLLWVKKSPHLRCIECSPKCGDPRLSSWCLQMSCLQPTVVRTSLWLQSDMHYFVQHTYPWTERSSGWQPWYSQETLKLAFNVSNEYHGCQLEDLFVLMYVWESSRGLQPFGFIYHNKFLFWDVPSVKTLLSKSNSISLVNKSCRDANFVVTRDTRGCLGDRVNIKKTFCFQLVFRSPSADIRYSTSNRQIYFATDFISTKDIRQNMPNWSNKPIFLPVRYNIKPGCSFAAMNQSMRHLWYPQT